MLGPLWLGLMLAAAGPLVPDGRLQADRVNALMAVDADAAPGLVAFQPGSHARFWVQGWREPGQWLRWTLRNDAEQALEATVVVRRWGQTPLRIELSAAGQTLSATLPADAVAWWERLRLDGRLALPAGESQITLRLAAAEPGQAFEAQVQAVELVRPEVRAATDRAALAMRADPAWFQAARYGIMVHWTAQSMPLTGEPKPYAEAAAAFDVERFAEQMARCGAGFVVFTTAHALQYFPAPLAELERRLPGRCSQRDLVGDLADALARRGIRLMLYYHLGAPDDAAWMAASGFWEAGSARLFDGWQAIVREAGERYGSRLAGWWFDDGATSIYPRSAPWEALARAAKAGNPQRLISFNAWELGNPTPFGDYCTGEGCQEPRGFGGVLQPGGDGRYPRGSHAGLQASACLITERDWGHFQRNTPLPPPKWTADQLEALLRGFIACRNVPIFDVEIAQDGQMSEATMALFERVRDRLR